MTVLAADVRTTATSGVGSCSWGGFADPHAVITRVAANMMLKVSLSLIEPLYRMTNLSDYLFTTITTVRGVPKKTPVSLCILHVPVYVPSARGAVRSTPISAVSPPETKSADLLNSKSTGSIARSPPIKTSL